MGTMIHDAIVVTSYSLKHATRARSQAILCGLDATEIIMTGNGYVSFLIAPDGSKMGWADSDKGDKDRAAWLSWARGNIHCTFVAIQYGEVEGPPTITAHDGDKE